MKKSSIVLFIALSLIILLSNVSHAITIEVSPSPALINQSVTAKVAVPYVSCSPKCDTEINFGDDASWTTLQVPQGACASVGGAACLGSVCNLKADHIYKTAGKYKITVRHKTDSCTTLPATPDPAIVEITINAQATMKQMPVSVKQPIAAQQQACPTLTITSPQVLASGMVGKSYSYQLQTTGSQAPIVYSIASGSLPPGLSMNQAGVLSGTPTTGGTYSFTVRSTDNCILPPSLGSNLSVPNTVQKTFSVTVNQPVVQCPALNINLPQTLTSGIVGTAYSAALQATGGKPPVTFSLDAGSSPLPPGLNISPAGLISGIPATAGTYSSIKIRATDSCSPDLKFTAKTYSITVNPLPLSPVAAPPPVTAPPPVAAPPCLPLSITSTSPLPSGTVGMAYSYQLQTTGSQAPIVYSIASGSLPPGLSMSQAGVLSGTPTTGGVYSFTVRSTDNCILPSGPASNMNVPNTVQKVFSITVNQPVVQCPALNITSPQTLTSGTVGTAYSAALQATGGKPPVTFSLDAGSSPLPPGLNISPAGLISGIPATAGTYSSIKIRATDSCSPDLKFTAKTYSITVNPLPPTVTPPPVLKCPAIDFYSNIPDMVLPPGIDGIAYSTQLAASGGQPAIVYSKVSGDLPPGLIISPSGLISGTPALPNEINPNTGKPIKSKWYEFTVRAKDNCAGGGQTADKKIKILVQKTSGAFTCKPVVIMSPATLTAGFRDKAYSYKLAADGETPFTHSLVSGSLPPGLSLNATTGEISGTPATVGSYSFTILFVDNCLTQSQFTQKNFTIQIQEPPMNLSVTPTPSSFNIPQGQASSKGVTYNFSGSPSATTTLQSTSVSFIAGGTTVGTVQSSLTANIIKGSASVPEVINVPIGVIQKATLNKITKVSYVRTFTGPGATLTATVDFNITTAAGADFDLSKIELYFAGKAVTATVERNKPDFKAFVDVTFVGSGQMSGEWRMDGNLIANVFQTLTPGPLMGTTVQFSQVLPTFNLGTHVVTFVVKSPVSALTSPAISFFVVPAAKPKITSITPDHWFRGVSHKLTVTGTNLDLLSDLNFGAGITKGQLLVTSQSLASVDITVAKNAMEGERIILMKSQAQGSSLESSGVKGWVGAKVDIIKIEPGILAPDHSYNLTLTGHYFYEGMTLYFFPAGWWDFGDEGIVVKGSVTVLSENKATLSVEVKKYAPEGEWNVCVDRLPGEPFCDTMQATLWVKSPVPPTDVKPVDHPKRGAIKLLTPLPGQQGEHLSEYTIFKWEENFPGSNDQHDYEIRFYRGGTFYTEAFQGSQQAQGAQPDPNDKFELLFKDSIIGKLSTSLDKNANVIPHYSVANFYQLSGVKIADLLRKGVVWWEVAVYDHQWTGGTEFTPEKELGLSELRELNIWKPQWGMGLNCIDQFKGGYGANEMTLDNMSKGKRNDDWVDDVFKLSGDFGISASPYQSHPQPAGNSSYSFPNVFVDWGDGTVEQVVAPMAKADSWRSNMVDISPMTHKYTSKGLRTVSLFMVPESDVQNMNPVDIPGNADIKSRGFLLWCSQRDIQDRDDPFSRRMLHLESIDIVSYNGIDRYKGVSEPNTDEACKAFGHSAEQGFDAVMSSCDKLQATAELKYWGHGNVYLTWTLNREGGSQPMVYHSGAKYLQSEERKGLTQQTANTFTQDVINQAYFGSSIYPMPGETEQDKWNKKYSLGVEAQIDLNEVAALDAETTISLLGQMADLFSANSEKESASDVNAEAENWRPGRLYAAQGSAKPPPSQPKGGTNPYANALAGSGVSLGVLSPSKEASQKGAVNYITVASGSQVATWQTPNLEAVPHQKPYYVKSTDFTYKVKKSLATQPCYFDLKTASGDLFEISGVHCNLKKAGEQYTGFGNMTLNLNGAQPLYPLIHINGWTLRNDGITVKQGEIHEDLSQQANAKNIQTSGMNLSMEHVDGTAAGLGQSQSQKQPESINYDYGVSTSDLNTEAENWRPGRLYAAKLAMAVKDSAKQASSQPDMQKGMMLTLKIKPKMLGLKLLGSDEASWQGAAKVTPQGDWFWMDSQPKEIWIGGSGFKIKSSDFRIDLSSKEGLDTTSACGGGQGAAWTGIHFGIATIIPNTFGIDAPPDYVASVSNWVVNNSGICGTATFGKFDGNLNKVKIGYNSLNVHTEPFNLLKGTYHGMYVKFPWWGVSFNGDTIFDADGPNEDPYIHYDNLTPTPSNINLDLGPVSMAASGFYFERITGIGFALRSALNYFTLKGEGNTETEKTFIKDIPISDLILDIDGALHFINNASSAGLAIPTGAARVNGTRITPKTGTALIAGGDLNITIAGDVLASKTFAPPLGTVDYRVMKKDDTAFTSTGPDIKVEDIAFSFPHGGEEQTKGTITGIKQTKTAYQNNGTPVYAGSEPVSDAVQDFSGWQADQLYAMAGDGNGLPPGSMLLADAGSGQNWKDRFNATVNMNLFPGLSSGNLPKITIRMGNFTDVDDDYWLINFDAPLGPGVPIGPLTLFSINGGMFYNFPMDVFAKAGCGVQLNNVEPVNNGNHSLTAGVEIGLADKEVLDLKGQLTLSLGDGGFQARIDYCGWLFSLHPGTGNPLCDGDVVYGGGSLDGHVGCSLKLTEDVTFAEATVEKGKTGFHFGSGNWYVQGEGTVGMLPFDGAYLLNGDAKFYFGTDKLEISASAVFDKEFGDCDDVCLGASAYIGADLKIKWSPKPFYAMAGVKAGAEVHACAFDWCPAKAGRDIFGRIQTENPYIQVGSCFSPPWPIPDFSIVGDIFVPPGIHLRKEHCDEFKARYGF